MNITSLLQSIGLNEKESLVYLAALQLGPTTVQRLALNAELKRSTTYNVVASLEQKGLMREEVRGFKRLFVPEHPDRLRDILAERTALLECGLPALVGLFALEGEESAIKMYEGTQGIRGIYEGILREMRPHEQYYVVSDSDRWFAVDEDFNRSFIERRAKKNIRTRLLLADTPAGREQERLARNQGTEVKMLPAGRRLAINLVITKHRLILHQLVPPVQAIAIENRPTIDAVEWMFELLWETLPAASPPRE